MGRDLKLKLLTILKDNTHLIIKRTMSKIYKIEFNDCVYFGSTKQKYLSSREARHNYNLKHCPVQKLYQEAIKQGIEKLECKLVYECSNEERLLKETELIKNTKDKIILNDRLAFCDLERRKQINRKYAMTERGKESKRQCDKRYAEKHREQIKEKRRQYYEKLKHKN
jgi:predicted peroxiredoxin